uniref:ShKT domain-containing protein n=1 Tax=Caenorhabditis tropicalis TaxID=1561998 RepID=A0A1I7UG79_9PELO
MKTIFCILLCVVLSLQQSSSTVETTAATGSTATPATTGTTVSGGTTATGATAASGATTASSCADDPNTDCSQYTSLCSNAKYGPLLHQFCSKTCGFCGGGSTAAPVACVDSSTNCANWNTNGFCSSTFYNCTQKKQYCAKTCNLCSTTC